MEIKSDIPAPQRSSAPFKNMNVGDSFEGEKKHANAAHVYGMRYKFKFCTRKQTNGKYRIWRIE